MRVLERSHSAREITPWHPSPVRSESGVGQYTQGLLVQRAGSSGLGRAGMLVWLLPFACNRRR